MASFALPASVPGFGVIASRVHLLDNKRILKPPPQSRTVLHHVRVFDGETIGWPTSLYIKDGLISEPFEATCGSDVRVIDAKNRIAIPGLIDAHVHVQDVAGLEDITGYGVTTAMVMACRNYTLCNFMRDYPDTDAGAGLASVFSAGYGATGPGSLHARLFNVPDDQLVYPGANATALIENAFNNGSDYYKICAEQNGPSLEMQTALVAEVQKLGYQAMTHASSIDAYDQAIPSLTNGIQHIPDDGILTDAALETICANRQFVTPTMNIFKLAFADPAIILLLRGYVPTNESYEAVVENVSRLHQAGIPVLAGTDAVGTFSTPAANFSVPFGLTLHWELENLVEAGLSPAEALRAATSLTARMHRLHDRGVISPGMRADLVLLDADPLANISNTQKIAMVFVAGAEHLGVNSSSVD
ncbi:hypothetical protein GQ53DRAFT_794807 [Thozetella sp. PMI_491]|nr:hypothetical protein GQ53DRAFT_794807 [Thozetella sp. PMI_491]